MRKHPKRLSEAGIGPWRYAELRAVCRQYPEARRTMERARNGIIDRRPGRGAWKRPDPTGNSAVALAAMPEARVVKLVEESARAVADRATALALIKSVAWGCAFDKLRPRPPCGHNQFNATRLAFYIELDRRMIEG